MILLLIFFLTSLVQSQTNEIRSEVREFNIGKNKKEKIKIEKIYRGKQLLVTSMIKDGKKSRIFNFNNLNCSESDEDGDGFMETFIIFNDKTKQVEAFHRDKDGSIEVDSTMAKKFKESFEKIDSLVPLVDSKKGKKQ